MKIDQINSIFFKIAVWSSGMILLFIPLFVIKDIYETRQLIAKNPETQNEWGALLFFIATIAFFYYLIVWGLTLGLRTIEKPIAKFLLLLIMLTATFGPIVYWLVMIQ